MAAAQNPLQGTLALMRKHENSNSRLFKVFSPVFFALILAYLCLVLITISPYLGVKAVLFSRRRSRFEGRMRALGRTVNLNQVLISIRENQGTVISEYGKKPGAGHRIWWTADDLTTNPPLPLPSSFEEAETAAFQDSCLWLFEHYTSPVTGNALLVVVAGQDRKNMYWWRDTPRFVELICPTDAYTN